MPPVSAAFAPSSLPPPPSNTHPIRLVPITSPHRHASAPLPPSPPSTPSQSPRDELSAFSWDQDKAYELRSAVQSMSVRDNNQPHLLPDTPDATPLTISPAEALLRHQPSVSALQFIKGILPNIDTVSVKGKELRGRYIVEDAGMELVTQGWTGAVVMDLQYSLTTTSLSSSEMSRDSGSSSDRITPRRTLVTKIGLFQLDTNNLRTAILDVLDHATERLRVDNVMFVLDRSHLSDDKFRAIVHGLCYVGASIVGHGFVEEDNGDVRDKKDTGPPRVGSQDSCLRSSALSTSVLSEAQEESLHKPRCVAKNLVLLSVDV